MRRHSGFSLLEILVAFSIMGLALTLVMRIFGSGVNAAVTAEDYTLAVQIAESLMARTGVEAPLQIGENGGVEGGAYRWSVSVFPAVLPGPVPLSAPADAQQTLAELFEVSVRVSWGESNGSQRQLVLNSLKAQQ